MLGKNGKKNKKKRIKKKNKKIKKKKIKKKKKVHVGRKRLKLLRFC